MTGDEVVPCSWRNSPHGGPMLLAGDNGPGSLGAVRADSVVSKPEVRSLVRGLSDQSGALTPSELIASRGVDLRGPGLYSWWVDVPGASDLALGLGQHMGAGLIYAGLAGATRSQSGRPSKN